jgi:hypothetical protein
MMRRVVHLGRSTCHAISGPLSSPLSLAAQELPDTLLFYNNLFAV